MNSSHPFVAKYARSITATLDCLDRVVCKGNLPTIGYLQGLRRFVDSILGIRRMDFMPWAKKQSERSIAHAQALAQQADCPFLYLQGHQRKEKLVSDLKTHHSLTHYFPTHAAAGRSQIFSARRGEVTT